MTGVRHLAALLLTLISVSPAAWADCADSKDFEISTFLLNFHQPLVSEPFAEKIAIAFFETHYPADMFKARLPASTVDLGDRWSVTFDNALFDPTVDLTKRIQVKRLGIEICKSNGAILRIK
jgi:hypothetical protein